MVGAFEEGAVVLEVLLSSETGEVSLVSSTFFLGTFALGTDAALEFVFGILMKRAIFRKKAK